MAEASLRLVIFDPTDTPQRRAVGALREGAAPRSPGLSPAWYAGALMHRLTGAAHATFAAATWPDALEWAADIATMVGRPIASIQIWGHGGWGWMQLGKTRLDQAALAHGHPWETAIDRLRDHLAGREALFWLRCCSAFGSERGKRFAEALAGRLGCRVAGHTYIIGALQSGTRSLGPGEEAGWDAGEGVRLLKGEPAAALNSVPGAPNTISCFALGLPEGM